MEINNLLAICWLCGSEPLLANACFANTRIRALPTIRLQGQPPI